MASARPQGLAVVRLLRLMGMAVVIVFCLVACGLCILGSVLTVNRRWLVVWADELGFLVVETSWIIPDSYGIRYPGPRMESAELVRLGRIWSGEDHVTVHREMR